MGLFDYVVRGALGGKSAKETFTVSFPVQQGEALDSTGTRDNANYIAGALQHAFVEDVQLLRVNVKQIADNPINRPSSDFLSLGLDITGQRAAPTGVAAGFADVLPKEFSAHIARNTNLNRPGAIFLPYCVYLNDVEQTREGGFSLKANSPALAPIQTTIAALTQGLPSGTFVVPDKVDTLSELFAQRGRPVVTWTFAGVTERNRNPRRVSIASAVKSAEKRKLRQVVRDARDLLGSDFSRTVTGAGLELLNDLRHEATAALGALETGEAGALISELPAVLLAL